MKTPRSALWGEWTLHKACHSRFFSWPWIMLFCLAGGLLGWIIALVWPSPTRASIDLYVGFNPTAVTTAAYSPHASFTNIDDYKNWQMSSLNSLVYDPGILTETLTELQQQDTVWNEVSIGQLKDMLHASWRNAGRWRLSAKNQDPRLAAQAVEAWHNVILRQVTLALQASNHLISLQQEQAAIIQQRTALETHLTALRHGQGQSQAWRDILLETPASQNLGETDRQQILLLAATSLQSSSDPSVDLLWQVLRDSFPPTTAVASEYLPWLNHLLQILNKQASITEVQIQSLQQEESQLSLAILQANQESRGLSAALTIADLQGGDDSSRIKAQSNVLRPTGQMLLIGSCLGAILWAILWLLQLGCQNSQAMTETE